MEFYGECGNGGLPTDYLGDDEDRLKELRETSWEKEKWKPSDAVVFRDLEKGSRIWRKIQPSDDGESLEIIENGWDHEHCVICWWSITDSEDPFKGFGFRNDSSWLCVKCHCALFGDSEE